MQVGSGVSYLFDNAVVLVPVPIKAQLTDPLKVIGIGAANLAQLLNHISGMHLNSDQSHHLSSMSHHMVSTQPHTTQDFSLDISSCMTSLGTASNEGLQARLVILDSDP